MLRVFFGIIINFNRRGRPKGSIKHATRQLIEQNNDRPFFQR